MMNVLNNGDSVTNGVPLSHMSRNIKQIFSMEQYEDLELPYFYQEEKDYKGLQGKKLSKKVIDYCSLLKRLSNDYALWNKFSLLNDDALRTKFSAKTIQSMRLRYEIVGNVLKTIFMLHEKSKRLFMAVFKTISVKIFTYPRSKRRVKVVVLKYLGSNEQRVIDNIRPPLPGLSIRRSSRFRVRTENDVAFDALLHSSDRIARKVHPIQDIPIYGEEIQPTRQIQCGFENLPIPEEESQPIHQNQVGDIEHILIPRAEVLHHRPSTYFEELESRWPRPKNPPQPIATGSQVNDQLLYQLEANLQYLREVGLETEGLVLHDLHELNRIMNEQLELLDSGRLISIEKSAIPDDGFQILDVPPAMQIMQPVGHVPENVGVEPVEKQSAHTEERNPVTITENLNQNEVFQHEFTSAFLRAVGPPGSVVEIPLADVPFNLEQRAPERSHSPPVVQIGDLLPEFEGEGPKLTKTPRRTRNKYTFYTNVVISRKLNKKVRLPMHVPHFLRLENDSDELRHPFNKLVPFDKFELNEDVFNLNRRSDIASDEWVTSLKIEDNMIFELFDEGDDTYFGENELKTRIANLRESMRVPIQEILYQTSQFIFEPQSLENAPMIEDNRVLNLQVQPIIEDIQMSTQPRTANTLSNIPVPEPRASIRPSEVSDRFSTRTSLQIKDLLQRNQQPIDNRTLLQVPTDVVPIPCRVSMIVPRVEENLSNIPFIDVPGTSELSIQPTSHVAGAGVDIGEMIYQERVIEVDEGILPKRRRTTSLQGIMSIDQIPVQIEPQQVEQIPLLPQADPAEQQTIQSSVFPQTDVVIETVPSAAIAPIDQPVKDDLRSPRERITQAGIEAKLEHLYKQSIEPVCFITLCALTVEHTNQQKREIIAKVFGITLDLVSISKVKVYQEPKTWSPEGILIFWLEPEPTITESLD